MNKNRWTATDKIKGVVRTGFCVRALADDGSWKSFDVGEMSATERDRWMQDLDADRARLWLSTMLAWIRDNVKEG